MKKAPPHQPNRINLMRKGFRYLFSRSLRPRQRQNSLLHIEHQYARHHKGNGGNHLLRMAVRMLYAILNLLPVR